jgi:hypothetical protein
VIWFKLQERKKRERERWERQISPPNWRAGYNLIGSVNLLAGRESARERERERERDRDRQTENLNRRGGREKAHFCSRKIRRKDSSSSCEKKEAKERRRERDGEGEGEGEREREREREKVFPVNFLLTIQIYI